MTKQIRFIFLAILLAVAGSTGCAKDIPSPSSAADGYIFPVKKQAEKEISQVFDQWMAAVGTGSSDAVMKLYAEDAVLLPTLSGKVCNTPELRKEYFDEFTAKPNLKGVVVESHIRVFGGMAVNSGLYTFSYTKDGATVVVPARFSFVYHKYPQGWLIVDHHSSRMPTL